MEMEVADPSVDGKLLNSLLIGLKMQAGFEKWAVSLGSISEMEAKHKSGAKVVFRRRSGPKAQSWIALFEEKDEEHCRAFCAALMGRLKSLLDERVARNAIKMPARTEE